MAKYIGNPAFRVHTQSGTLLRALSGKVVSTSPPTYRVKVDTGIAPHAAYVIQGTRVLLPRDVLWSTATAEGTRKELIKTAVKLLGKTLRTKARIRVPKTNDGSIRLLIMAMDETKINMRKASIMTVGVMGAALHGRIRENMSLTDHSLQDLASQGHPYARRHGSIRIH